MSKKRERIRDNSKKGNFRLLFYLIRFVNEFTNESKGMRRVGGSDESKGEGDRVYYGGNGGGGWSEVRNEGVARESDRQKGER